MKSTTSSSSRESNSKNLRIVFFGTAEFAVPSLKILVENNYTVAGVITAPDKPAGRGLKPKLSPVKEFAVQNKLPVLQPPNLKSPDFIEELSKLSADLQVVVAFRMLPEAVWNMPPKGTFNLHSSLLPQYRGAAPINWAIINGEKETGVTTFFLQHEIDTGNIIFQEKEIILPDDNAGTLYEKLKHKGADLVLKTVKAVEQNSTPNVPQHYSDDLKKAPKIFKATCEINWNNSSETVYNFIRGMSPYPGAWTTINGKTAKIFAATAVKDSIFTQNSVPGQIFTDNKSYLRLATADGFIEVKALQLEGKKKMDIHAFLRGNKL